MFPEQSMNLAAVYKLAAGNVKIVHNVTWRCPKMQQTNTVTWRLGVRLQRNSAFKYFGEKHFICDNLCFDFSSPPHHSMALCQLTYRCVNNSSLQE